MAELKKEEAKKDLEGILDKAKSETDKIKESNMSEADRKRLQEEKAKAQEEVKQAEEQAKKDAELLAKEDEDISDENEKKRKQELLDKQQKDKESKLTTDEKIQKIKDVTQRRIDEIHSELLQTKDKSSKEAIRLNQELEVLRLKNKELEEKLSKPQEGIEAEIEKAQKERISKYLTEDASLPKEKRREMPKEELDEWYLEDPTSAVAWINKRELRRAVDMNKDYQDKEMETKTKNLFEKQLQSFSRVAIKHPELDIKKRKGELKAQGKTEDEITDAIRQENKKYDILLKISEEHPEWKFRENGPELVMAEMEKRLADSEKQPDKTEVEELREKIENLSAELAKITSSDIGVNSTLQINRSKRDQITQGEQSIIDIMRENKFPQKAIDEAVKKYREKQGIK